MVRVTEVSAEETHAVRRLVLRDGRADAPVAFAEDDGPDALHLAAVDEPSGEVVGVATFFPSPYHGDGPEPAWQLRGMAVVSERQGTGVGAVLLAAGVDGVRARGGRLLWANGRDSALGFYERQGWKVVGEQFEYGPMKLPHHVVLLLL